MRHGILEITVADRKWVLLPFAAIRYFLAAAALLALLIISTEYFARRECAAAGRGSFGVFCPEWRREDSNIARLINTRLINQSSDVIWRSALLPAPEQRPSGRKRILVLGDSFVEGDGLTNVNNTWWRELQRELERRGYWNLDVIAAG